MTKTDPKRPFNSYMQRRSNLHFQVQLIRTVAIIMLLFSAGCASYPTSASMLKNDTKHIHHLCLDKKHKDVFAQLKQKPKLDFENKNIGPNPNIIGRIISDYNETGTSNLTLVQEGGVAPALYPLAIELSETDKCLTDAKVYVVNVFWENRADEIVSWMNRTENE